MKRLTSTALAAAAIGVLACLAQPALAGTVTLADLVTNGGTIQSGDKTFSNFMYSTTGVGMPSAGDVNVIPITQGGSFGIRFQGGFFAGPGHTADALISFTVTSGAGNITGASMHGNPDVIGVNPNGSIGVTETFLPELTTTQLSIFDLEPGGNTKLTDSVTFAQSVHVLNVQKDILASAGEGSVATLSLLDQLFPQGSSVPEPASLMLVGIGALGLFGYRRWSAR